MDGRRNLTIVSLIFFVLFSSIGSLSAAPPFGNPEDVKYAKKLWRTLEKSKLVGKKAINVSPYKGAHPHGSFLATVDSKIKVSGHKGDVIVKKNFMGKGISKMKVASNPAKYLDAITVMFRRAPGYDAANKDWFWVKFSANGKILKNPKGMLLAGRVAKGAKKAGCIACHKAAPGGDMVFIHDRY